MFMKMILGGTIAFAPLMAVAGENPAPQFRTITVQGGQGSAITLHIPVRDEAPYALTGSVAVNAVKMVPMQFGQGTSFLVPRPQ